MKSILQATSSLLCLILILASCGGLSKEDQKLLDNAKLVKLLRDTTFSAPEEGIGLIVPRKDIQSCLDKYKTLMPLYGFTDSPITNANINIQKTIKRTDHEAFRAFEFMNFLEQASLPHANPQDQLGRLHLTVRVKLGIYDSPYLKLHPDTTGTKFGRIGVFLVTCTRKQNETQGWLSLNQGTTDDDDPQAFDFGGLHP